MSYEDIIHFPHHVSSKRAPMSLHDRAAQFAPFAALTGHDAIIRETARQVDAPVELTESRREELNRQLQRLADCIEGNPRAAITHYIPDLRKPGGAYVITTACIKKVDEYAHAIVLADGSLIDMDTVIQIKIVKQCDDQLIVYQYDSYVE